jgi:uncharacterized protein
MMSIQNKLNRLKKHIVVPESTKPSNYSKSVEKPIKNSNHNEFWEKLGAAPYFFDDDYCIVRKVKYPLEHVWGKYPFAEIHNSVESWSDIDVDHPLHPGEMRATDLLFFDTETTGLSGGVGNTIFLLGMSQIKEDHVLVQQFFLPGPGSEAALYHYFLHHAKELKNLVTYNGKSFDWPQVKTRHTLLRDFVPSLPQFGHFDLLHGARRLWKDSLPAVRLSVVEKDIIDVDRLHDTPGYMAPMLYFQYCNEGDPSLLEGVFKHNEWDVLSLITLYTHMSSLVLGKRDRTERETFEIARWFESLGEMDHAVKLYEEVVQNGDAMRSLAKKNAARLYKRQNQIPSAVEYWQELLSEDRHDEEPAVELSKYYEHKEKDYQKALYFAEQAFSIWKAKNRISKRKEELEKQAMSKRIERLELRINHFS